MLCPTTWRGCEISSSLAAPGSQGSPEGSAFAIHSIGTKWSSRRDDVIGILQRGVKVHTRTWISLTTLLKSQVHRSTWI